MANLNGVGVGNVNVPPNRPQDEQSGVQQEKKLTVGDLVVTPSPTHVKTVKKPPQTSESHVVASQQKGFLRKIGTLIGVGKGKSKLENDVETNLPELVPESRGLGKMIATMVKAESKILKKGESRKLVIPGLENHKFIIIKDKNNKVDLFIQDKLLGEGGCGQVFKATSVFSGEEIAAKYSKPFRQDLKEEIIREVRNLEILDQHGGHENVQDLMTVSVYNKGKQDQSYGDASQMVTFGRLYSRGDLEKDVEGVRLANWLNVEPSELRKMDDEAIHEAIEKKIDNFSTDLKIFSDMRKELVKKSQETPVDPDQDFGKAITTIDKAIRKYFTNQVQIGGFVLAYFLGEEAANKFEATAEKLKGQIIRDEDVDIKASTRELLTDGILKAVKKCQANPPQMDVKHVACNVLDGMRFVHSAGMVHGDIKRKRQI